MGAGQNVALDDIEARLKRGEKLWGKGSLTPQGVRSITIELSHFIDGQRVKGESNRFGDVYNPATGEVTKRVPLATKDETKRAIAAAEAALPSWSATPSAKRAQVMFDPQAVLAVEVGPGVPVPAVSYGDEVSPGFFDFPPVVGAHACFARPQFATTVAVYAAGGCSVLRRRARASARGRELAQLPLQALPVQAKAPRGLADVSVALREHPLDVLAFVPVEALEMIGDCRSFVVVG